MIDAATSKQINLIRLYPAPLELVWAAWTDPKRAAEWWGPRGFTITTHSKDLRPGGTWNYTMHGPDGTDYPNITTYFEVEPRAKLVYDHGANEKQPPLFRVTVQFKENAGLTQMAMSMQFATAEAAESARRFIQQAGGNATWDRLGEYLEKQVSGVECFLINRSFDVPRETLFEVWTNPKLFAQWLAPTGMQMEFRRAEIKPGGSIFYSMSGNGLKMYARAEYLEVARPERIVYAQQFCDEHEKVARHPLAPTWPATMLTTITFHPEGPSATRITIKWEPHGETTEAEQQTFVAGRGGMTAGWTGSLDKLEALLDKDFSH